MNPDLMGAEEARRILDACDPTTPEGCQLASACRTVIALREILEGSTEAPTLTEIAVHASTGGLWRVRFEIGDPRLCGDALSADQAERLRGLHSPGHVYRWWALDAHGFLVAWPKVDAGATREGDGR